MPSFKYHQQVCIFLCKPNHSKFKTLKSMKQKRWDYTSKHINVLPPLHLSCVQSFTSKGRHCTDDKLTTAATKTRIQKLLLLLETTEVNDAKWIMISLLWFPLQYFIVSDDLPNIKGVVASIFHWRTMQCNWHTQGGNMLTKHQKNCHTVWMAAE